MCIIVIFMRLTYSYFRLPRAMVTVSFNHKVNLPLVWIHVMATIWYGTVTWIWTLIARFMEPTWGPSGANRTQVGPMLAPWTLLSGECLIVTKWFAAMVRWICWLHDSDVISFTEIAKVLLCLKASLFYRQCHTLKLWMSKTWGILNHSCPD